jgi:hypothetical protein
MYRLRHAYLPKQKVGQHADCDVERELIDEER